LPEFDPQEIGRYSVVRVHFEFPPEPPDLKRFVVLKHVGGKYPHCKCLKTTSNTAIYERTPELLAGCVIYEAEELELFNKKTAIQPDNSFNIAHEHFERYAKLNKYMHAGKMPEDFHERLVKAIIASPLMSTKQKNELLVAIDEDPLD
jgi:hypothetical protein